MFTISHIRRSSQLNNSGISFPMGSSGLRGAWPSPVPTMVCAHSLISKSGVFWKKFHFACCVQGSHLTSYYELCLHQLVQNNRRPVLLVNWHVSNHLSPGPWQSGGLNSQSSRWWILRALDKVFLEICVVETTCFPQPNLAQSEHYTEAI